MKKCTKCGEEKELSEFYKDSQKIDKSTSSCKKCNNIMNKKSYLTNKDKISKRHKEWRLNNPDYSKNWRSDNKEYVKIKSKEYRENNKEKIASEHKKWRDNNKEYIKNKLKQWYENNKEYVKECNRLYNKNNRDSINIWNRSYTKIKRKNDVNYRIKCNLRSRLYNAIQGNYKPDTTLNLLGCNLEDFKLYISEQFYNRENGDVMDWDNYGLHGWHLDHIVPIASFDLSDESIVREVFHYTNLQPLWVEDNLRKGSKLDYKVNKT